MLCNMIIVLGFRGDHTYKYGDDRASGNVTKKRPFVATPFRGGTHVHNARARKWRHFHVHLKLTIWHKISHYYYIDCHLPRHCFLPHDYCKMMKCGTKFIAGCADQFSQGTLSVRQALFSIDRGCIFHMLLANFSLMDVILVVKCLGSGDLWKEGGEHVKAWLLERPKVATISGGEVALLDASQPQTKYLTFLQPTL